MTIQRREEPFTEFDEHGHPTIADVGYHPNGAIAHRFDPATRTYTLFSPDGSLKVKAQVGNVSSAGRLFTCQMRRFAEDLGEAFIRDAEKHGRKLPIDLDIVAMSKSET